MMKRISGTVCALMAGVLVFALAGCTGESVSTGNEGKSATAATATASAGTQDTSSGETGTAAKAGQPSADTTSGRNEESVFADIDIKDYGVITVRLDPSAAPQTVDNFVSLAESGFYDGLTFHRIMEGFMMQGGDPLGNGTGGSDREIKGEFSANGVNNPLSHTRGAISMARSSASMDSASSQFFIVHQDATFLDGQYAAFGFVTEGLDIVDRVCADAVPVDDNGTIPAEEQPVITSVTIR